ncbi:hypothetical protein WMY93_028574 [Mugilogobius chulae]|uniref:Cortactin-binding protein-2 N-terminal domain-containing protein n=1 Tax=Mugilogobius chulae TaxID=88201 RepID=A0AAW0MS77_9GOBI
MVKAAERKASDGGKHSSLVICNGGSIEVTGFNGQSMVLLTPCNEDEVVEEMECQKCGLSNITPGCVWGADLRRQQVQVETLLLKVLMIYSGQTVALGGGRAGPDGGSSEGQPGRHDTLDVSQRRRISHVCYSEGLDTALTHMGVHLTHERPVKEGAIKASPVIVERLHHPCLSPLTRGGLRARTASFLILTDAQRAQGYSHVLESRCLCKKTKAAEREGGQSQIAQLRENMKARRRHSQPSSDQLSRDDLLFLLSLLEGELQARDEVIAVLKSERTDRAQLGAHYGQRRADEAFRALYRDCLRTQRDVLQDVCKPTAQMGALVHAQGSLSEGDGAVTESVLLSLQHCPKTGGAGEEPPALVHKTNSLINVLEEDRQRSTVMFMCYEVHTWCNVMLFMVE